jgi:hypothetical protein
MRNQVETIFATTSSGLDIFRFYIDHDFSIGKTFSSPLREDKNPSFNIYLDEESGKYLFKDFARDNVKGDAIQFVKLLKNIDFNEAINIIAQDLSISKATSVEEKRTIKDVNIVKDILCSDNLVYFDKYGISKEILYRFKVSHLKNIQYKSGNSEEFTAVNPIFFYEFEWGGKIYKPNASANRFMYVGDKPKDYVFGYEQLPDTGLEIVITGGEKDVLTFASLEINSICFNSETADISDKFIEEIKRRFKYVLVCFDTDNTGIAAAEKLAEKHKLINLKLPINGEKTNKDISDYVRNGATKDEIYRLLNQTINESFQETMRLLSKCTFDYKRIVKKPIPLITIEGHNILSYGNIMVIAGKVKTGKSAVVYNVISGSINHNLNVFDSLGVDIEPNLNKKAVVHFDTEQSEYDWHSRLMNAMKRINVTEMPEYFQSYHILEFTIGERLRIIEKAVEYNYRKFGGIHLVLVDGVADLVKSVNDEQESNLVVDTFHRLSVEYKCPIILVVHLNPDGIKTRGHLGSQLDRKAESVIMIERDDDICTINPKYCRNANAVDIPLVQFTWDSEKGYHVSCGIKTGREKIEAKIDEYKDAIDTIFSNGINELNKSDFKEALMKELGIKRSASYNAINFMLENEIILEDSDTKTIKPYK